MALRDWFAGQALLSTLSASASHDGCYNFDAAAHAAFEIADAMLAARSEPKPVLAVDQRVAESEPGTCRYCGKRDPAPGQPSKPDDCDCCPF